MGVSSVEIVYRGVVQQTVARRIGRAVVLGVRKKDRLGFTFGRYGDSPERVGIPAKCFAVTGDSEKELEQFMTPYELPNNDVTLVLDDTLCKGTQSWAWQGLQSINRLTKPGGTLLVLSQLSSDDLLKVIPDKEAGYNLAVVKGSPKWSTLWKYDDDNDARMLGALAKVAPDIISLDAAGQVIAQNWKQERKIDLSRQSFGGVQIRRVRAGEGVKWVPPEMALPGWQDMKEALVVPSVAVGKEVTEKPYQAERNPNYRSFTQRTRRPVIDFSRCRRCSLCWLHCPDAAFDITPDGYYNINFEYCNGCGICASICPAKGCIGLVHEQVLSGNARQWEAWQQDSESYARWLKEVTNEALV